MKATNIAPRAAAGLVAHAMKAVFLIPVGLLVACAGTPASQADRAPLPDTDAYCLTAQRVVGRTEVPMQLVLHDDFERFVKSKSNIEGPTIHQYNWYDVDGNVVGISCKMKSAEHLNSALGEGSAGPEGWCHDMNRALYEQLQARVTEPVYASVSFDPSESLDTKEQRNMIGPLWLKPLTLTSVDDAGGLHIATRGFVVRFDDPRFQKMPPTWRGTHYCHLVAPTYFEDLLAGNAEPGAVVGGEPAQLVGPNGERVLPVAE